MLVYEITCSGSAGASVKNIMNMSILPLQIDWLINQW